MDNSLRKAEQSRHSDSEDRAALENLYNLCLRTGESPLDFAKKAEQRVRTAQKSLEHAIRIAAQDIEYMLCETANKIITDWPLEIKLVELNVWPLKLDLSTADTAYLVETGEIAGQVYKMGALRLDPRNDMPILCSKGVSNTYPDFSTSTLIWNKRFVNHNMLVNQYPIYYRQIYLEAMHQLTRDSKRNPPKLGDYFQLEYDEYLRDVDAIPIFVEQDQAGGERVILFRERNIQLLHLAGNELRFSPHIDSEKEPVIKVCYEKTISTMHFEAERRKRGEPASRLLEYLRERDLK